MFRRAIKPYLFLLVACGTLAVPPVLRASETPAAVGEGTILLRGDHKIQFAASQIILPGSLWQKKWSPQRETSPQNEQFTLTTADFRYIHRYKNEQELLFITQAGDLFVLRAADCQNPTDFQRLEAFLQAQGLLKPHITLPKAQFLIDNFQDQMLSFKYGFTLAARIIWGVLSFVAFVVFVGLTIATILSICLEALPDWCEHNRFQFAVMFGTIAGFFYTLGSAMFKSHPIEFLGEGISFDIFLLKKHTRHRNHRPYAKKTSLMTTQGAINYVYSSPDGEVLWFFLQNGMAFEVAKKRLFKKDSMGKIQAILAAKQVPGA